MAQERQNTATVRSLTAELRDCLGPTIDKPPACGPNGSACEPGSMCISGACTFCKGAACGMACLG
ncbi:MAG: hypothetical protein ACHREM_32190, partial [Polyangiales bacterium]